MAVSPFIQSVKDEAKGRPRSTDWYKDKIKEFGKPSAMDLIRDGKRANIPYVGAGVAASALGMDKGLMRMNFESAGIPQPKYLIFNNTHQEHLNRNLTDQIEKNIGYPCFIKPCNGGSSIGVSKVLSREDLESAWELAKKYDQKIIIEEIMLGRELECAVIGNDSLLVSGVAEIRTSEEFYQKVLDSYPQSGAAQLAKKSKENLKEESNLVE